MWVHMITSKYAHARVPSLKQHLKQNIDISKMIFPELYFPPYMRFGILKRIARFMFLPITLFAVLVALSFNTKQEDIQDLWDQREECLSKCQSDHFPDRSWDSVDYSLTFVGNKYDSFYVYNQQNSDLYQECKNLIPTSINVPYSNHDPDRVWRVQTCFNWCQDVGSNNSLFTDDTRPTWGSTNKDDAIICLNPKTTNWEDYVPKNEICMRGSELWINFLWIIVAILITDFLQIIFESATLYSIELTYRPTTIERLRDLEKYKGECILLGSLKYRWWAKWPNQLWS